MIHDLMIERAQAKGLSELHVYIAVAALFALTVTGVMLTKKEIPAPPKPLEKQAWLDMICAQADGKPLRIPHRTGEAWGDNRGISYGRRIHEGYYTSTWRGEEGSPWRGIVFEPRYFGYKEIEYSTTCGG